MKISKIQRAFVALACVGMLMPQSVLAAPAAKTAPVAKVAKVKVSDVALRSGGTLVGMVVDGQAKPMAKTDVSIRMAGKEIARTVTDKNGVFATKGLRGGQYEVVTAKGVASYRLWAAKTAPPTARSGAMVVTGDKVVTGQYGPGPILGFMTEYPFVAAGIVATAIAVPVAVADDDDPSS